MYQKQPSRSSPRPQGRSVRKFLSFFSLVYGCVARACLKLGSSKVGSPCWSFCSCWCRPQEATVGAGFDGEDPFRFLGPQRVSCCECAKKKQQLFFSGQGVLPAAFIKFPCSFALFQLDQLLRPPHSRDLWALWCVSSKRLVFPPFISLVFSSPFFLWCWEWNPGPWTCLLVFYPSSANILVFIFWHRCVQCEG